MKWQDVEDQCRKIACKIACSHKDYSRIIPIVRGGMIPALMLSKILRIPIKETIYASSYNGKEKGELDFKLTPSEDNVLIVDDVSDTGETLEVISRFYQNCDTAVLVHKPETSRFTPTYYGLTSVEWIDFPWDIDPLK